MGVATSRSGGTLKTLVLGCMSSGKSTFMKQMIALDRKEITQKRELYVYCLQLNLLRIFIELRNVCLACDVDIKAYEEHFQELEKYKHREAIPDRVRNSIIALKDAGLVEVCKKKQRILALPFNYNSILQRTTDILSPDYIPTDSDILYSYAETVGLNVETICVNSFNFELIEIPGHHIWRKRWEEYYAGTSLVVFIVDLSELCDLALYKGHLENKTLSVFTELAANPLLAKVSWMVLFNKNDTFNEHAASFDFKKYDNYATTSEEARVVYRRRFMEILPKDNSSYWHLVSLTNNEIRNIIHKVFSSIGKAHIERERQQQM